MGQAMSSVICSPWLPFHEHQVLYGTYKCWLEVTRNLFPSLFISFGWLRAPRVVYLLPHKVLSHGGHGGI